MRRSRSAGSVTSFVPLSPSTVKPWLRNRAGSVSSRRVQPSRMLKSFFAVTTRCAGSRSSSAVTPPPRNLFDQPQHARSGAETERRLVDQPLPGAFHGEREGGAGRDRVEAEVVAQPGRLEDRVLVADAAQRAEGEEALVFQPHLA